MGESLVKVVVTGGAGFIGSNLGRELLARPDVNEVVALDDLSTGNRSNLDGTGIPSLQQYTARYCERTGRPDGIPNFEFYLAYNMFRLAGILQGIMKRVVDGTAASAQAVAMGKSARPIAEQGWQIAQSIQ